MKKLLLFFFLLLTPLFIILLKKPTQPSGTVIVLNGPSVSGKSSIQKEFQQLMMPNLWVKVGIDNLFDNVMPDITPENMSFWQSPNSIRWVESSEDADGNPVVTLFTGEQGDKVAYAMNSAIAEYAKNGCNVVVDYIAYNQDWFKDLREKLKNIRTYYVFVYLPLETLEQREYERKTSPKGHARSHYFTVDDGTIEYDLTAYTAKHSAQKIAQQIKKHIKHFPPLGAPRP